MKKERLKSEGEELDLFLAELEKQGEVKEIAGLQTGFSALSRALNGISPGLYLLIGPPACGKSAFAKQLLDQIAQRNSVPALFFAFAEKKNDLRIRTLARLSELESRDIRRGASYLLHTYGAPKRRSEDPEQLPASWEKLRSVVEQAKSWLDQIYMYECDARTTLNEIEQCIREVREIKGSKKIMAVIDDSQRLEDSISSIDLRLPVVVERLQDLAMRLNLPLLATWPELPPAAAPDEWAEGVVGADVVIVMENDVERTKRLNEPSLSVTLHIVKNRGGERGSIPFDFYPAFSKFAEASLDSTL